MDDDDFRFMDFKGIIENLVIKDITPDLYKTIDGLFKDITNINRKSMAEIPDAQIEEMAAKLWKWIVTKRGGMDISRIHKSKVRHIACKLICMCDYSAAPEECIHRRILMTMKTGKGWLDNGKAVIADEIFEAAIADLQELYSRLMHRSSTEPLLDIQKLALEKHLFKVISYQAESAVVQKDFQRASACVMNCREMLVKLPMMTNSLLLLCYNFGVEFRTLNKYEESCFWLRQSYEIGKMADESAEPEMLAKVLRLLANVYLDWNSKKYFDNAVSAINLSNKEHLDPAGLFAKIKIFLKGETDNQKLLEAAIEVLHHDMTLDFCLSIAKLLLDHQRDSVGLTFLNMVCEQFKSSENIGKALVFHIEMLLQWKRDLIAKEKIEEVIVGQQMERRLATKFISYLHNLLWKEASESFETQNYSDALLWYSYSLRIYECDKIDLEFAKLKRNMAACYLNLKQRDKAKEAVMKAEELDPGNIHTQFYMFKLAVLDGDVDQAIQAIGAFEKLLVTKLPKRNDPLENIDSLVKLFNVAAQFALENGQNMLAEMALEYFAHYSVDPQEIITTLKCLFRLRVPKVSEMPEGDHKKKEMDRLVTFLKTILQKLPQCFIGDASALNSKVNEVHWFRKTAWNLAFHCGRDTVTMRKFFILSYKLSQFCPSDQAVLITQKTCLMMAAAIDLEQARKASAFEQTKLLNRTYEEILKCKEVWHLLKQSGDFANDPCETLLLLYEFEVRAKKNDPLLENFMEPMWDLPHLETKTLESIASLAMETPAHYPSIAIKALKMVLAIYRNKNFINVAKFSKCVHDLIMLLMPNGVPQVELCPLEDILGVFEDALKFISQTEDYPEMERVWLMVMSWNTGIYMYGRKKYVSAEKWCGMSVRFLEQLGSLKRFYERQVNTLYRELMEAVNKNKGSHYHEE